MHTSNTACNGLQVCEASAQKVEIVHILSAGTCGSHGQNSSNPATGVKNSMNAMRKPQILNDTNSEFSVLRGVNNHKTFKLPARTVTQCMRNKQKSLNLVEQIVQSNHKKEMKNEMYNKTITITKCNVEIPAHNAATMTEHDCDIKPTAPILLQTLIEPCFNDSYKSLKPAATNIHELKNNHSCSRINTKRIGMAMEKYWCRLQSVSFVQNVPNVSLITKNECNVINLNKIEKNDEAKRSNKKYLKSIREMPVKLTTALDGSMLYCCSECVMAYSKKELLEEHFNVHNEDRRLEGDDCGISPKENKHFKQEKEHFEQQKEHKKEHFEQHKQAQGQDRPFACDVCFKTFKRNEHLKRHAITHSGDKSYACFRCSKTFSRRDHLVNHLVTHRQENPTATGCKKKLW